MLNLIIFLQSISTTQKSIFLPSQIHVFFLQNVRALYRLIVNKIMWIGHLPIENVKFSSASFTLIVIINIMSSLLSFSTSSTASLTLVSSWLPLFLLPMLGQQSDCLLQGLKFKLCTYNKRVSLSVNGSIFVFFTSSVVLFLDDTPLFPSFGAICVLIYTFSLYVLLSSQDRCTK